MIRRTCNLFQRILIIAHMGWGDLAMQKVAVPNDPLSTDLALLKERENLPAHKDK